MVTVFTNELRNALNFVTGAVCKDKNRPLLQQVHIKTQDSEHLIIEASNGYRLSREVVFISEYTEHLDVIVPPFKVKAMLGNTSLELKNGWLEVASDNSDTIMLFRNSKGEYLKTDPILSGVGDPSFSIYLSSQALKSICNSFGNESLCFEFHGDMGAVIIKESMGNKNKLALLLPQRK